MVILPDIHTLNDAKHSTGLTGCYTGDLQLDFLTGTFSDGEGNISKRIDDDQ